MPEDPNARYERLAALAETEVGALLRNAGLSRDPEARGVELNALVPRFNRHLLAAFSNIETGFVRLAVATPVRGQDVWVRTLIEIIDQGISEVRWMADFTRDGDVQRLPQGLLRLTHNGSFNDDEKI